MFNTGDVALDDVAYSPCSDSLGDTVGVSIKGGESKSLLLSRKFDEASEYS